jgi:hypothetical protein
MFKLIKISTLAMLLLLIPAGSLQAGENNGINRIDNLSVDIWVNKGEASTYYYGEDLAIYFRPSDDCYVVVYDIDPSGNVSMLFPSDYSGSCRVNGDEVYRIPDPYDDYRLEIAGPSGSEYIYAVATYNPIDPPDFIRYENFDYGNWDYYYNDFIHSMSGERADFANDLNNRIANAPHVSASTMFYIDEDYRPHRWYRHWTYDPYYTGSVWVGTDYPGCEIWIDGVYYHAGRIMFISITGSGTMSMPRLTVATSITTTAIRICATGNSKKRNTATNRISKLKPIRIKLNILRLVSWSRRMWWINIPSAK